MSDKKQQEMLEQIRDFNRKKDYYDILGVTRSAEQNQIKKAYRKLALRFHPDKNQYPGAKDVFKKVSNAYTHLIDAQKRAHYDRYGPEQDQRPPPQYRQYHQGGGQDYQFDQFDDIFRAFFGQMPPQARQRHFRQQQHYRQNGQANPQAHVQQLQGVNIYFILFLFFMLYTIIAPLFESRPNFSTQPSHQHRYRSKTSKLGVQFYVNSKYYQDTKNPQYKRKAQMTIDKEYVHSVQRMCDSNKRQKRNLEQYAYRFGAGSTRDGYLRQARAVDMTACHGLNELRTHYSEYLRELERMRL